MDQRPLLLQAGICHGKARLEIVGSVDYYIVAGHKGRGVLGRQPQIVQFDRDVRIEASDGGAGTLPLRLPDKVRVMDDLPLQVGKRDLVVVHDAERSEEHTSELQSR